jgi:hypothetical protein
MMKSNASRGSLSLVNIKGKKLNDNSNVVRVDFSRKSRKANVGEFRAAA